MESAAEEGHEAKEAEEAEEIRKGDTRHSH